VEELSDARGKGEKDKIKRDFLERLRKTMDKLFERGQRGGTEGGRGNARLGLLQEPKE
jgi:hypothetical protein